MHVSARVFYIKILTRKSRKTGSLDTWQSERQTVPSISRSVRTNEHACTWDRARRAGHVSNILPREFFLFNWFNRRKTRRDRLQTPRGFSSSSPPRHPRFRQPTAVTRRQNQPPSEWKRQPLFAVSLSPVPFPRLPLVAVIPSRISTPLFFPLIVSFSFNVFLHAQNPSIFSFFLQLNSRYISCIFHSCSRLFVSIIIMFLTLYHFSVSSHFVSYAYGGAVS